MEPDVARILVVDDNEMNRDMLSRRLARRNFDVETAENGTEALGRLQEEEFDLVLLDIMMPGVSGLEVLETIRQTASPADLPVIMATAKNESADIAAALRMGANDYVTKPLDFQVVLARTENQIALKRANQEIKRLAADLKVRNEFIRQVFGRYMSGEVATSLLDSPENLELGGEKRVVTMLMSDLRGFAAMSEQRDPQDVVTVLNHYLGSMTDVITYYDGTIDEFIGDAIFVIFGAPRTRPDDAERAVRCAVAMQQHMADVNETLGSLGLPPTEMGIGIHTGEVVVGNVGSIKRAKYGVVGQNVNITSRIETFSVGHQILISESTKEAVKLSMVIRDRFEIDAKGLQHPLTVFDVAGFDDEACLESNESDCVALPDPQDIRLVELKGKHITEDPQAATIERLSPTTAVIRSPNPVPIWANVKISFQRALDRKNQNEQPSERDRSTGGGPDDVYAKVTGHFDEAGRFCRVRFTSVPELARITIADLLAAVSRSGSE